MNTIKSTVLIILMLAMIGLSKASAQDLNALLEAVDKIEAGLAVMVQQEAAARDKQIGELKASIAGLDGAPAPVGVTEEQLADVMAELAVLRVEVAGLKRSLSNNAKQLASIDPDSWVSPGTSDEKVEEVSQKLEAINDRLAILNAVGDQPAPAANPFSGLRIGGFFDMNATHQSSADDNTQFDLGQVEIDLDHDVSEKTYVRITPVWNSSAGVLSLGPAYVRVQLMGYENRSITELSVSAGKMDIPFGIGLLENGSVNRKIPTRPKAISQTHGGWGDYGMQFDLKFNYANFVGYAVNGFASTAEVDSVLSLSLGVPEGTVINTTPAYAFGTRIGATPFGSLEFGTSFAVGQNESNRNEMMLIGADLQYSVFLFEFKGEYIYHSLNRSIEETNNRAYYFETRFATGRWTVASRYGSFKPDGQEWDGQFCMAAGFGVTSNVEVKVESLFKENTSDNSSTVQLMTRF